MLGLNSAVHRFQLTCWTLATLAALVVLCGRAEALPIAKFQFTARVSFSDVPWTTNGINVGDTVTGIVSYDLASTDSQASPDFGRYNQSIVQGVQISVGGFTFASSSYFVDIQDDDLFLTDGIAFEFNGDVSDGGITVLGMGNSPFFDLTSSTNIFDGDALFSKIDLNLFDTRFGGLLAAGTGSTQLQYEILSVQRIPEPASAALLVAGLMCLFAFARRRRA